jgi:ribosome maturation factor RimP
MKSLLKFLIVLCLPGMAGAQIPDRTETDCDGVSRSIYEVLDQGTPLIIAAKGFDCSTCMGHAPGVAAFSQTYAGQIEVWGAMNYLYNPATPTCLAVENWNNAYNWTNIFTFADVADFWLGTGLPIYRVVNPETKEVAYQGPNWNTASAMAIELLLSMGISEPLRLENSYVNAFGENLKLFLEGAETGKLNFRVLNMLGQQIAQHEMVVTEEKQQFDLPFYQETGVYLFQITQNDRTISGKFFYKK